MNENETLNKFSKLHLKAYKENTYYTLINDNINYETFIKNSNSLEEVYNFFINGIKFNDNTFLKLSSDDIIGFYLIHHESLSQNDINFICKSYDTTDLQIITEYINRVKNKILNIKQNSLIVGYTIESYLSTINSFKPVDYEIIENNEIKMFNLTITNSDLSIRPINEGDILDIFDTLEPNSKFPVIIYSNINSDCKWKCSNNHVNFTNNDIIIKDIFSPNSITVVSENGEKITLDFEQSITSITINIKRSNDDRVKKIKKFIPMINFEENNTNEKISGKINFFTNKVIGYYSLYEWIITDPIVSTLFYVDETSKPWCSKDIFYIFFKDFSNEMIFDINTNINIVEIDSYFRISIPTQKKESISGFTIMFTTKSKDILPSFIDKFSKLLSQFLNTNDNNFETEVKKNNKIKIYTKNGQALTDKAPELFKYESKSHNETLNQKQDDYYSKICQAKIQPIIINEDEIQDWINYGREPVLFPPPEWGLKKSFWFVCPKNSFPKVSMKLNKQDDTDKIKYLPCCLKKRSKNFNNDESEIIINQTSKVGSSELINTLGGNFGSLNDSLSTFLSISFSKEDEYIFKKQGTVIDEKKNTYLNSAILALLIATKKQINPNKYLNLSNNDDINESIIIIRNLMAQLSPDIYRQELYDMSDTEIIESILNQNTFIDPYLYYRGLEIIFDVQIFTFTSNIGRKNPLSDKEDSLIISSLEVPRCKYTHIRHNNNKDIVCLYKNYGSYSKILPACELIICNNKYVNITLTKIDSSNEYFSNFSESLFNLLDKNCHPFEWEKIKDVKIGESCYDDPYSTINWNNVDLSMIGKLEGQGIDIYGKTTELFFNNWTLIIPPTQPLIIFEPNDNGGLITKEIKIKINNKQISHMIFSGGKKIRAPLKSLKDTINSFDVTSIDDDGVWIEFNGKKQGIKILCISKNIINSKNMLSTYTLINKKNNISILFQIINWLWRHDYNYETKEFPNFIKWWNDNTEINDTIIFNNNPNPKRNCNNYMFPRNCNNFQERLKEMTKLWPFYFYRGKIHVSKGLYDRISNFFNIEDIYSRGLTIDDIYGEPGKFITDLIQTDEDFKTNSSIILNNIEQVNNWLHINNSSIFKYNSLYNTNIIREKIDNKMKKMRDYYIYRETIGDNIGQIYIIQNAIVLSQPVELSALQIANYWKVHEYNPGCEYIGNDNEFILNLKYILYRIGPQGNLEVSLDKSAGGIDYLQIFCYDNNENFAAMLPLLS